LIEGIRSKGEKNFHQPLQQQQIIKPKFSSSQKNHISVTKIHNLNHQQQQHLRTSQPNNITVTSKPSKTQNQHSNTHTQPELETKKRKKKQERIERTEVRERSFHRHPFKTRSGRLGESF
jgi:hypothetical protein